MSVIIYGDFNCPYSYLASQRADRLIQGRTAEVDWRAVEHDRWLPASGTRSGADRAGWAKELAEVAALALPGERPPAAPPSRPAAHTALPQPQRRPALAAQGS